MTRKEALKQIAQRCMEGEDVDATELYNVLGKHTNMEVMESLAFYIALPLSRDAVAELEAELLPDDAWSRRMDAGPIECSFDVRIAFDDMEKTVYASAPTEPLARLAALCLALAEMEE